MAKSVLYKRKLFNPQSIMDLVNLGECVVVGENDVYLFWDNNIHKFVVDKQGITSNGHLETPDEKEAVQTFWIYSCGDNVVKDNK